MMIFSTSNGGTRCGNVARGVCPAEPAAQARCCTNVRSDAAGVAVHADAVFAEAARAWFGVAVLGAALLGGAAFPRPASAAIPAQMAERVEATRVMVFNIYLPLTHRDALDKLLAAQQTPGGPQYRRWITPAQFEASYGADKAAMDRIAEALHPAGLTVTDRFAHGMTVQGSAAAVERSFGIELHQARFVQENGVAVQRVAATHPPVMPAALQREGAVIAAFDNVIRVSRHSRTVGSPAPVSPQNRTSSVGPYWFTDLKQAYRYPSYQALTGQGVAIGILISGGFQQSDMNTYFNHEGLNSPSFTAINVYGGLAYSAANSGETHLDLQQSGGMAPQADIGLYNIPDLSDESIFAGLTKITRDNIAEVVSMSFGGPELSYTAAYSNGTDYTSYLGIEDDFFKQGNSQGITFVASSGDYGSNPIPAAACFASGATAKCGGFVQSVEVPAASPDVTGVGGTNLVTAHAAGSLGSAYASENANYDPVKGDPQHGTPATGAKWGSGGGNSIYFAQPSWQTDVTAKATYRSVPDLALHMGGCPSTAVTPCGTPRSADVEIIGGKQVGTIGTSASAPDFAGLVALIIQSAGGRLGNINPVIYSLAKSQNGGGTVVFHRNIKGSNGAFSSAGNYSKVLGNGTLFANTFVSTSSPPPPAGVPGTASNP